VADNTLTTDAEVGERFEITTNNVGKLVAFVRPPAVTSIAQLDALYAVNWAVADWYLDGTTGNDANAGTTSGAPLRTGAELARRLGPYALWGQSVTVHVGANGMTDGLVLRGYIPSGMSVDVVGTTTVLVTDVVATFSAVNHGTPASTLLTAVTLADWTPYRWRRVRLTSGASVGAVAFVALANPAGAGLNVASIAPPCRINTTSSTAIISSATAAPGDGLVIESLPVVPSIALYLDGPVSNAGGARWPLRQWSIQGVDCPVIVRQVSSEPRRFKGTCFGSRVQDISIATAQTPVSSLSSTDGFLWAREDASDSAQVRIAGALNFGLVGDGVAFATPGSPLVVIANVLFQGCSFNLSNTATLTFAQFFDVPLANGYCLQLGELSTLGMASVSGNRNLCPIGLKAFNGTRMNRGNTTYNLTAGTADTQHSTAPAVNLTTAQFFQTSDYFQKGITPAMVAGATTVTVPWYDQVNQQVTATHAAFGGTTGQLSVQQISNSQFTITSSSNLDTSTVRWHISPLGRNIFISGV
jgi:hypothetical protein